MGAVLGSSGSIVEIEAKFSWLDRVVGVDGSVVDFDGESELACRPWHVRVGDFTGDGDG